MVVVVVDDDDVVVVMVVREVLATEVVVVVVVVEVVAGVDEVPPAPTTDSWGLLTGLTGVAEGVEGAVEGFPDTIGATANPGIEADLIGFTAVVFGRGALSPWWSFCWCCWANCAAC